jgi:hypothetical protein
MRLRGNEPCPCGSGRKAKRCHAPGRWVDNVARAEQDALADAHNFPAFHPHVRPRGERFEAFAERVARGLSEGPLSALPDEVSHALSLLGRTDCTRLIDAVATTHPGDWRRLCGAVGDRKALERALLSGAVLSVIGERRAPARGLLEMLERTDDLPSPAPLLALVTPPQLAWSIEEAEAAAETRTLDELEEHAWAAVSHPHEERVREFARRLEAVLPFAGLPRVSKLLSESCSSFRKDPAHARKVAAALLVAYAFQLAVPLPDASLN